MNEFEPAIVKKFNCHIQGGLGPDHWRRVSKTYPINTPFRYYASEIISGTVTDLDFMHRQFIPAFEWSYYFWQPNYNQVDTTESHVYAFFEQYGVCTLTDYIKQNLGEFTKIHSNGTRLMAGLRWISEKFQHRKGQWQLSEKHLQPPDPPVFREYMDPENPWKNTGSAYEVHLGTPSQSLILGAWLLSEDDLPDPLHTSPDDLEEKLIAISKTSPKEIRKRLSSLHFANPWNQRDNSLHFAVEDDDFKLLLRYISEQGVNVNNKIQVALTLQTLYHCHYGVRPYVLSELLIDGREIKFMLISNLQKANSLIHRHKGKILLEGEIENPYSLPEPLIMPKYIETD